MRIDVGQLLKSSIGETAAYQIDHWELAVAEGAPPELVSGVARLLRTQAGVLATVHLALRTRDACSRCLRDVDIPLEIDLEEEFRATVDVLTGAPLAPPEDRTAFVIDAQQVLDLSEAVRQYREVALPMQPLCRPECAGLCPTCGSDLNQGPCQCPREPADSRWSALAELGQRLRNP